MSQDEFTKLFTYVEGMREEMRQGFSDATDDRADIRGAIAELSAQISEYHQDMVFLTHKVDRLER